MARRPGVVDAASRLAPLAEHLETNGFVPVRDAMVLYGTKRRDEVLAVVGRRLNVTLVQTALHAVLRLHGEVRKPPQRHGPSWGQTTRRAQ